jgi:primosomal protein N''
MKLTKEEFRAWTASYKRAIDRSAFVNAQGAAEFRAALAEHDPRLAQMMETVQRNEAQIAVYLAERLDAQNT